MFFAVGAAGEDFGKSFGTLGKGGMAEGCGDEAGLGLILGGAGFDVDVEFLIATLGDEKGSDDSFASEEHLGVGIFKAFVVARVPIVFERLGGD